RLSIREGDALRIAAGAGADADVSHMGEARALALRLPANRAFVEQRTVHVRDRADPAFLRDFPDAPLGPYAWVDIPLVRRGEAIGVIAVSRGTAAPYSAREIMLLETFADQAVIAIENARLFSELERRNADLNEALEQQTATSEILRVISSSPTDVQPVLATIV